MVFQCDSDLKEDFNEQHQYNASNTHMMMPFTFGLENDIGQRVVSNGIDYTSLQALAFAYCGSVQCVDAVCVWGGCQEYYVLCTAFLLQLES